MTDKNDRVNRIYGGVSRTRRVTQIRNTDPPGYGNSFYGRSRDEFALRIIRRVRRWKFHTPPQQDEWRRQSWVALITTLALDEKKREGKKCTVFRSRRSLISLPSPHARIAQRIQRWCIKNPHTMVVFKIRDWRKFVTAIFYYRPQPELIFVIMTGKISFFLVANIIMIIIDYREIILP